jgi:hypothetical protein
MARADLTKLLGVVGPLSSSPPNLDAADDGTGDQMEVPTARPTSHPRSRVVPDPEPLYLSYQRKETRLRAEQQNGLTLLARRLSRAKGAGGERITENTLIRVAVDLLLARSAQLTGNDEVSLRSSLDLP